MKKLILSTILAIGLSFGAFANTASVTVVPGTMTNLFTGSGKITRIFVTATTSTNAAGLMVDSPTNTTAYTTLPYTNTVSYITNQPYIWTNYFGVLNTNANSSGNNFVLVDAPNVVGQATNNYISYGLNAAGNSTITVADPNINIVRGAWFTNTGVGTLTVLLQYTQQ